TNEFSEVSEYFLVFSKQPGCPIQTITTRYEEYEKFNQELKKEAVNFNKIINSTRIKPVLFSGNNGFTPRPSESTRGFLQQPNGNVSKQPLILPRRITRFVDPPQQIPCHYSLQPSHSMLFYNQQPESNHQQNVVHEIHGPWQKEQWLDGKQYEKSLPPISEIFDEHVMHLDFQTNA